MIRTFTFTAMDRVDVTLSDFTKISIDSTTDTATLKIQADGTFPTAANLYVISAFASPGALRKLVGFQSTIRHFKDITQTQVTGEGFRLSDGTNQYWWNGSAWAISTASWNTEAQVAANIAAFTPAVTAKKLAVVANLTTTDKTLTPQLIQVKVAYEVKQQSWVDDIFFRSLVRDLSAQVKPIAEVQAIHVGGTTVDINAAIAACGVSFTLIDVDSIFNFGTDPNMETNLLQSYNAGTGIATLSGSLPPATSLRLNIIYTPNVIVLTTSPDYNQIDVLPSIVIEQIRTTGGQQSQQTDEVINKAAKSAKQIKRPWVANLEFDIRAIATGSVDLLRLVEALVDFADDNPTIRSQALDETYRLQLTDEFDSNVSSQGSGVCEATASFKLHDVTLLKHVVVDVYPINDVKMSFQTQNQTIPVVGSTATATSSGAPPLGNTPQQ